MYVCGITPYDATHLGHAATYVAFDLLNRAWRSAGHEVRYVQNVTDVDDPLLERANATGEDWESLAERETALFRAGHGGAARAAARRLRRARSSRSRSWSRWSSSCRRTGACTTSTVDLYFSVTGDPAFGEVSGWSREQMMAGVRRPRRRPGPPGQEGPARLPALAVGAPG